MEIDFERYLDLPLYYESEKQDILDSIKKAQQDFKNDLKKYNVISIRNSVIQSLVLKKQQIENEIESIDESE